ncbi:MAG TPA: cupin domain-containing protein, partial [Bryobacteraceae bacterium]|nr:cupin domain-containing protein [Bryobacteraceae bacterium]
LRFQPNRRKSGQPIPRVNSAALTRELREGSTLVLDSVDELHEPVTELAEALERVFRVRIQVNAYAGWRTSHGFDLHWDDHDVFILQVAGRKHWKVYGMTRKYPLARDVEPADEPPQDVLWEGLLHDGDLLYIPRGWWHVATPLDEPTLHLTVGINNHTGADLLAWFVDRLRKLEIVRRDLPHWRTLEEQRAFAASLREGLLAEWTEGIVGEYLADTDAKSRSRAHFSLPSTAMPDILPEAETRFRWAAARYVPVVSHGSAGEVSIQANGRKWRFAQPARAILEQLVSGRELTMAELESAAGGLGREVVQSFVKELVANGLVVLR